MSTLMEKLLNAKKHINQKPPLTKNKKILNHLKDPMRFLLSPALALLLHLLLLCSVLSTVLFFFPSHQGALPPTPTLALPPNICTVHSLTSIRSLLKHHLIKDHP